MNRVILEDINNNYWIKIIRMKNNRKPHNYRVREKVLVCDKKVNKYEEPYKGPYPITKV